MKRVKIYLASIFMSLALFGAPALAQQACPEDTICLPVPVLTGVQAEGKGIVVGTTFDPELESGFRIVYYVSDLVEQSCVIGQAEEIGQYDSDTPLSNFPVFLDGVETSSVLGKCIFARAFIFQIESESEPSNFVQLITENPVQPQIVQQTGVLGASTTTTATAGASTTLADTGNPYALSYILLGLSLVLFTVSAGLYPTRD